MADAGLGRTGDDVEVLAGGVANAGAVVRVGDVVFRPAAPQTPAVHAYLRWVRDHGCDGVPEPLGIDDDGRERLGFIAGDVPLPPYPAWAQTDEALASVARLLGRVHRAAEGFVAPTDAAWNLEMVGPTTGPVVCHHDVCLENVVFRHGEAVALLDFEFAAPGQPIDDLATMARMCVPVIGAADAATSGWPEVDVPARLRVLTDAYGLDADGRGAFLGHLADQVARGGEFVARRIAAGEQAFVDMVAQHGGMERFDRRRAWFAEARPAIRAALA